MKLRTLALAALLGGAAQIAQAQPAATAAPSPAKAGDHVVRLTNGEKGPISAVYVAKAGSTDASDDLLGKQVAAVGKTVVLKVKDPGGDCLFDLQLLMNDGSIVTLKGVNLCQTNELTAGP